MGYYDHKDELEDGSRKPEKDTSDWYTSPVNSELKRLGNIGIDSYGLSRLMYIYTRMDKVMQMVKDMEQCKSSASRYVLKDALETDLLELKNLRIFDDRCSWLFDSGK